MSGFRSFTRQLGYQPGVQLNPLADQTDGTALDNTDQIVGIIARLTRGRIDRPFRVNRNNLLAKTGAAEALRVNALNEAKLQLYEALNNGAAGAVVQRLVSSGAAKSYAVINFSGTPTDSATTVSFSVSSSAPSAGFSISVMHQDCFNDGIKLSLHAEQTPVGGAAVANKEVTLRLLDVSGNVLFEFFGSLDPAALDDNGQSVYLPDVAARQTDSVVLVVSAGASVPITSNAYGRSVSGIDNWAVSDKLVCFTEAGTTYTTTDYDNAISLMRNTMLEYGYLGSGGSQNVALIGKVCALGIEINLPVKIDVPGTLSPSAAITWVQQLNFDSHLIHYNWAPLEADDPLSGGRSTWGVGGLQIGYSCARNARVNAKGFAPKNFPIAGKEWALNRVNVRQTYTPSEIELSDLAKSKINPSIFQVYNGGGRYVFTDSLTSAKSTVSYRKLQNVAEMALTLESWVTLQANELLQLPMSLFIKRMTRFMETLLEGAQASQWLVPSTDLPGNAAWSFEVKKSEVRPADVAVINFYTSFDGVARQIIVQQTLVK